MPGKSIQRIDVLYEAECEEFREEEMKYVYGKEKNNTESICCLIENMYKEENMKVRSGMDKRRFFLV